MEKLVLMELLEGKMVIIWETVENIEMEIYNNDDFIFIEKISHRLYTYYLASCDTIILYLRYKIKYSFHILSSK
jgi:hypothetical protein